MQVNTNFCLPITKVLHIIAVFITMKKVQRMQKAVVLILSTTMLFFYSMFAIADQSAGFYGGAQIGYGGQALANGNAGTSQFDGMVVTAVTTEKHNANVAGRMMLGYHFNQYTGLELGMMQYGFLRWRITTFFQANPTSVVNMLVTSYALDFLARLSYQPTRHLLVFFKTGLAYVRSKVYLSTNALLKQHAYRPEIAVGLDIPINKTVAIETTYSYIFRKNTLHDARHTPALHAVLVGVSVS